MREIVVHWFRRDLRLNDNRGLYKALTSGFEVLPVFIFDRQILDDLSDKKDRRMSMLVDMITELDDQLREHGSALRIFHNTPLEAFRELSGEYRFTKVFTNEDYEPYARQRDEEVGAFLNQIGAELKSYKDQVIFGKDEVTKDDGKPYTVYTPYMKKWRARLEEFGYELEAMPSEEVLENLLSWKSHRSWSVEDLGFERAEYLRPIPQMDDHFLSAYQESRDLPAENGVSRLSIELRFGTLSVREIYRRSLGHFSFVNELIWREFYMMILYHFPHVVTSSFKPAYDRIRWEDNEAHFEAWKAGRTGIAFVDAGMRQLNETGWMHNRLRMVTASFLTKNLGIDWRRGEAYFAEKLLDFELSSNNGGWQWAAGTGCDAAPYFRVFNPESQQKKFDPRALYTRRWVPEYQELTYRPIVDLKRTREEALVRYKSALQS